MILIQRLKIGFLLVDRPGLMQLIGDTGDANVEHDRRLKFSSL